MFAERALVARAEVTLAPAKAETYYPSGNSRVEAHPSSVAPSSRIARPLETHAPSSISHHYRPPNNVSEARSARPVDLPDRSTSDRPRSASTGNPDRARFRSFVRSRARTFAETFICDEDRKTKIRRIFFPRQSRRAHASRVPPRVLFARAFERMSGTPRDRSVALILIASSSRARRRHARVFTTTIR